MSVLLELNQKLLMNEWKDKYQLSSEILNWNWDFIKEVVSVLLWGQMLKNLMGYWK